MKQASVILLPAVILALVNSLTARAEPDDPAARMQSERFFEKMDRDADGTISRDEAAGAVKTLFDTIDADTDGLVTPEELSAAIRARTQRMRQSRPVETAAGNPGGQTGFQRPKAAHRTSRPVPTPWLGYGNDDSPAVRNATYLKTPEEIRAMVAGSKGSLSYPQGNGLRIVGTGHSWMAPGYRTLPAIAQAAGLTQRLRTHTSGGETGGLRMIWEKENGILSHQGEPAPTCMAAITTGQWDVMTWGCYTNDRPEYYFAWIDFCMKFNPAMEFYVFNAWPQYADGFGDGDRQPRIENYRARAETMHKTFTQLIADIDQRYPDKVHILPTCDAMLAALELYFEGNLPGVAGLNRKVDGRSPSIWSDGGHLGAGMDRLEGYVFYATLYQRSPELIEAELPFHNAELDRIFRKIAWQAVVTNPLSDVTDRNGNGIGDGIE